MTHVSVSVSQELYGVEVNRSLPLLPPALTSTVQVLSVPPVCLRITATACSVGTSLPSSLLGYTRLTRALSANSRSNESPLSTMCEYQLFPLSEKILCLASYLLWFVLAPTEATSLNSLVRKCVFALCH